MLSVYWDAPPGGGQSGTVAAPRLVYRAQLAGYAITRNDDGYFHAERAEDFDFEIHDIRARLDSWADKLNAATKARATLIDDD